MDDNLPEVDKASLAIATEASVSAGRKKQLDQYEPIDENVTLTVEFPDGVTPAEKKEMLQETQQAARDAAERAVMRRYEEHVRKD